MKDKKTTLTLDNENRIAEGSITVSNFASLVGVEARADIEVLDYTKLLGVAATGEITVTDYEALADITVTVGEEVLTEGVDFDAETSNGVTAMNLAAAIDALSDVSATADAGVITVVAAAVGRDGNDIVLSTDAEEGLSVPEAHLLGGKEPLVLTIGEDELVEGTDFDAETSDSVTATNIAAAIDALDDYTATVDGAVVTIVAAAIGAEWNVVVAGTWDEQLDGAIDLNNLSGGLDEGVLTFNGVDIVQGTDFDAETSNTVTATNLASEINGISGFSATANGAVITILADTPGEAGNVVMSTNSGSLTLSQMAGGADYFYSDALEYNTEENSAVMAAITGYDFEGDQFATGQITIVDYTGLTGAEVVIGEDTLTEGVDWTAATSNNATATSLAAAIAAIDGLDAAAVGAVITIDAVAAGSAWNLTITSDGGADITVPAGLTGGADVVITASLEVSFDKDEWVLSSQIGQITEDGQTVERILTKIRSFARARLAIENGTASASCTLITSEYGGDSRDQELANIIEYVTIEGAEYAEYVAEALPGSLAASPVWRVKKLVYTGTDVSSVLWADGNSEFDNTADDMSSLTYS